MPKRLHRYYGAGYLHFITSSCYGRRALLGTAERCDLFLEILEQVRRRYQFVVVGYVVMPEHFHLLISEPERGDPSIVIQVLKQRFARRTLTPRVSRTQTRLADEPRLEDRFWQRRFYDFVVWTEQKRIEKLKYIHRNPVKRGLVSEPERWAWSSFRHCALGEPGPVLVNEERPAEMKVLPRRDG